MRSFCLTTVPSLRFTEKRQTWWRGISTNFHITKKKSWLFYVSMKKSRPPKGVKHFRTIVSTFLHQNSWCSPDNLNLSSSPSNDENRSSVWSYAMRHLSPAVPQGGTKDGWSLPAILIRFLKVQIFNNVPETYQFSTTSPRPTIQQLLWIGSPFLWFKKMVISCLPVMKFLLF